MAQIGRTLHNLFPESKLLKKFCFIPRGYSILRKKMEMMILKNALFIVLQLLITAVLFAMPQGQKRITDFGFHKNAEGRWVANCRLAVLTLVNSDYFEDVVSIEGQLLVVYLNLGNGFFSTEPNVHIQLPAITQELKTRRSERLETLATIRYENGHEQEFNLTELFTQPGRESPSLYRSNHLPTDSLNFQPVWSWTFPINYGTWPVTAGDIDSDGRVELISSMTHPDSATVGWLVILENDGDNNYRDDVTIPVNFPNSAFHQIKITDWDQDGNKELTCAVGYRIRIWEFYGDKNFQYFDTNVSFIGMKACSGIEVVDTDQNNQLELLTIFTDHDAPQWRSAFARFEFFAKNPPYFAFSNVVLKLSGGWFYSFAAGDMDNDGLIDILPGYAQLWPASPNTLYYEEFDHQQLQFVSKTFDHPYPIDPGFNVIDDLDGDSLNEVFITGVGGGYGGIIYLKSVSPDNYEILNVDSTLLKSAGSAVKTAIINNQKCIVKAAAIFDFNQNGFIYFIDIFLKQANNSFSSVWAGPEYELGTYIHSLEVLDTDNDFRESVIYKIFRYTQTDLRDIEKSPVSLIEPPSGIVANDFILHQNYPNPFNPETTILFVAPKAARVNINIFNIRGKLMKQFSQISAKPGLNQVVWKGTDNGGNPVSSGIYFYQLVHGRLSQTRKMVLIH